MMKKKNIIFIYILILIEFLVLSNSKIIVASILKYSYMFFIKIFPSLFPTMLIGMILVKNNVEIVIPKFIKNLFKKLFNFDDNMTNIFIMSIICGTPSNAIFINEYLKKGLINSKTAENLLCVTHFVNPLFVINTGINLFNSKTYGIIILLMLYLSNIIKAFILKRNFISCCNQNKTYKNKSIIQSINESIKGTIYSLLNIFSVVILFNMLTNLIRAIFNLNITSSFIINSILEMTGAITNLSLVNIPFKLFVAYYILSFGGLCIWMQVISSINDKNIHYKKYVLFRIL